jgi:hypothetical protein
MGLWWGLVGVCGMESGGHFYIGAFGGNLTSFAVKNFSQRNVINIYFIAICKDNFAVNCITVQHKKG